MTVVALQINRIFIGANKKVKREWTINEDGTLTWRKRVDAIWHIERHNFSDVKTRTMYSREGQRFYPWSNEVTLDDFVFLYVDNHFQHLATGLHFTATQINKVIFKDRATWPLQHSTGERWWPSRFIRRYNRIEDARQLTAVKEALNHAA